MHATEIILIVIGGVIFLLGYLMPARKKDMDEEVKLISEDEIRNLIAGEVGQVRERINDIVEEAVSYSIEKTERAMERLTNEKIMAINEYSDTVLEEINKNHKEVVFLYDMLNDKHDNMMATINEATMASDEVKQTLKDAEGTVQDATEKADDVLRAVDEASARIGDVLRAADDAVKGVWDAQNAARVAREAAQEAIRIASSLTESVQPGTDELSNVQIQSDPEDLRERVQQTRETVPADNPDGTDGKAIENDYRAMPVNPQRVAGGTGNPAEQEFKPITPKRVEIIHDPDEFDSRNDGREMTTSEAFASLGFFAPKDEQERFGRRRSGTRRGGSADSMGNSAVRNTEERAEEAVPSVDIQFANENGRNSNERILELHKAGKSNMAIARELGLGLGEVKLVIDLFEGM